MALRFEILDYEFASLPHFGPQHVMARLAAGPLPGFPLFLPHAGITPSSSGLVEPAEAAELIGRTNPDLPAPPADALFVIAGQQAGLLTGPLYTFLKAISIISLAGRLSEQSGRTILPLFWTASEDHDVLEVNRVVLGGRRFVHEYEGEMKRGRIPQVADIPLENAREPLIKFVCESLRETEFTSWVINLISSVDFSTYAAAFNGLMRALFHDWELRIADPVALRPLTGRALAAVAERLPEVVAALGEGTARVKQAGFEPPLDAITLFEIVEGARVPLEFDDGGIALSTGRKAFAEAAEEIRSRPQDFSPGAALRPVVQDAALPVAVTLGGPSELLYLWQIGPLYDLMGFTRSTILPRISATFLEQKVRRAAEKAGIRPDGLFDAQARLDALSSGMADDPGVKSVEERGNAFLAELRRIEKEKDMQWLAKRTGALATTLEFILRRLKETKAQQLGLGRDRLEKVLSALMPGGRPQERVLNVFDFLNFYGPEFVRLCIEEFEPLANVHQVAVISTEKE